ncbi:MAG: HAMP domain-containing histidine kinase [Gammaproteobacteria bacterium]|nr:HAMP domain-containing histidine kinase [Gammaproteobacteria bacterium]
MAKSCPEGPMDGLQAQANPNRSTTRRMAAARERILANVGHVSRTPLNTIMLRAELLSRERYGPLTDAQRRALDSIVANVNQLTLFANNLLYDARANFGDLNLFAESFPVDEELYRILDRWRPLAERKGLALQVDLGDVQGLSVHLSRQSLNQVVSNLLDNAIKFTDSGTVSVAAERAGDGHLSIRIADTGRGVPEAIRERMFRPFWQPDNSATRDSALGIGLGLSIARLLVERQQGSIRISDRPGGGTEVAVTLPLTVN